MLPPGHQNPKPLGFLVGAVINSADSYRSQKTVYHLCEGNQGTAEQTSYSWCGQHGDVKKGKPELRKKVPPAMVIRQQKSYGRKDGMFLYFEETQGS